MSVNLDHRKAWKRGAALSLLTCTILGLGGCGGGGGGAPAKPGAKKEIAAAEESLTRAQTWRSQGDFDTALAALREGLESAQQGRRKALQREKPALEDLETRIAQELSKMEIEKEKQKAIKEEAKRKEEEEKRLAELRKKEGIKTTAVAAAVDPLVAEREKKEAERKKAEEQQKAMAALMVKKDAKTEDAADAEDAPGVAAAGGGAEGEEGDKPKAKPKSDGPFRDWGDKAPPISVDRIRVKDKFVFVYFQLYNKGEAGKRIGRITAMLKDGGNGDLSEAHGIFEYAKMDPNAADPLTQPDGCGLTAESHQVLGGQSLQLVAITDMDNNNRAAKAIKAMVNVDFTDGSRASESGPNKASDAGDPAKAIVPGL
ncbi:MAG: hypothetical protein AMXMBFR7_19760 [Planctomycetota bacterium]